MSDNGYVEVDVVYIRETQDAILVGNDDDEEWWIPKSLIDECPTDCDEGDHIELLVKYFYVFENGMI